MTGLTLPFCRQPAWSPRERCGVSKPRRSFQRVGYRLSREGQLWIALAFILGLIGWYKKINVTLLVSYTMAGLLIVNAVLARLHARRIRSVREPLNPVFANETAHAVIRVSNRYARSGNVEVIDTLAGRSVRWFLHGGLADSREVLHQPRLRLSRGRYRCDPLLVISGFPFGLIEYGMTMLPDDREQVVLPARGEVDVEGLRRWLARSGGEAGQRRQPLRRVTSDHADVRGVRPYRPGDSIRWIHWRTTARRGEPMVREYDEPPSPAILLVVDPWLPANPSDEDFRRLEATLELAASIAVAMGRDDASRLTLLVPGLESMARPHAPAKNTLLGTLISLADVVGSPEVSVPTLNLRTARTTARLLVSSRPRSPLLESLSRQAGRPFLFLDAESPPPWYLSPSPTRR